MTMISKTHTLDGVKVVTGMMVWDYDLNPRMVGNIRYREGGTRDNSNRDPWYTMINPETGYESKDMNPSRMWFYHPFDHTRPSEP